MLGQMETFQTGVYTTVTLSHGYICFGLITSLLTQSISGLGMEPNLRSKLAWGRPPVITPIWSFVEVNANRSSLVTSNLTTKMR